MTAMSFTDTEPPADLDATIAAVLAEYDDSKNPYFIALDDGSFDRDDFIATQIQFYFAVIFFSRPMAAVAARIPHPAQRVEILRNVWEEHGEGESRCMHGVTFLEFLKRLDGIGMEDVERHALWEATRAFDTALIGAAVLDEYLVSVAMLGMIERMFATISARIGRAVVARGWLEASQMIHYQLHAVLDVKHSEDFFALLRPRYAASAEDRYYVGQGLRLGAYVFDRFYRDLHAARSRREFTAHGRGNLHARV
jgi:pyrroloquinoline-quinone synthase